MAKKTKNLEYYEGIGRRKEAVARVRMYIKNHQKIKKGEIYLNEKQIDKIYSNYQIKFLINPLKLTNNEDRFAVSIMTKGGGKNGQLEAIVHGISRCLVNVEKTYKMILKKNGLLTRDPRERERRKVGTGGKARRAKQSPKR